MNIVFLGVDGIGKSFLIQKVQYELSKNNIHSKKYNFYPSLFNLDATTNNSSPHDKKNRSNFLTVLKFIFYIYKFWIFELFFKGDSIVFYDRHPLDILVDKKRYRTSINSNLIALMIKFLPNIDYIFILHTNNTKKIYFRKKEVNFHQLNYLNKKYFHFKKSDKSILLSADKNIDINLDIILKKILKK